MKRNQTKAERWLLRASCAVPLLAMLCADASAMHIMEGFLPQTHAIA